MRIDFATVKIVTALLLLSNVKGALAQETASNVVAQAVPAAGIRTNNSTPGSTASDPADGVAQNELIQKLLKRIDQLEQNESQRVKAGETAEKQHEEREQKLLQRIGELESKVGSLEAGRVLPEITLSPDNSPTTRELDQKIRILDRKNELAAEAAEARAKDAPRLSIGQSGFALTSGDTNFALRFKGLVQLDTRTFFNDNPLTKANDGFFLRRARPIIEGTVFRDFDFRIEPDFAGSSPTIYDAYVNYRYRPELQLRAGRFKTPVGLELSQPISALSFNERSLVTDLVPNRDIGIQLWGDIGGGTLSYAVGVFNGTGDGRNASNNDFDKDREFAGRIFLQPFRRFSLAPLQGLGFGVGGSYSQVSSNAAGLPATTGGSLPGYWTADGQQQFFAYNPPVGTVVADGEQWRISPQLSYTYGPFGLMGEYAISHQSVLNGATLRKAELEHTAWEVSAQWVLTGEPASFAGITPKKPFSFHGGGWGAWQLVGRYGQLNVDDAAFQGFSNPATSASAATSWSVGINWWLNKNVRVLTSFSHTTFDGGGAFNPLDPTTLNPPATVTHQDEDALFTRIQLAF